MTFVPAIPFGGITGWNFLQRTQALQKATFEADPVTRRDEAYFREKIGSIKTAAALVSDRRLLSVALGAFGLDGDINNKAFIRKVLEEGTLKDGTLANKLADKQYEALSSTFGFGDFNVPRTQLSTFADSIMLAYKTRKFETSVGNQNNDMRLAMNARRELETLARRPNSDTSKWFTVLGNPPLRQVFEKAFGLPPSFVAIDLDKQVATLRARSDRTFGSGEVSQFTDPAQVDKLLRQFLTRTDVNSGNNANTSSALQILQQGASSFSSRRLSLRL